jgi:hypothetical protein
MEMRWKFFVGAAILSAGLLFKFGAPIVAIAAGIAAAAFLQWRTQRRRDANPRGSR